MLERGSEANSSDLRAQGFRQAYLTNWFDRQIQSSTQGHKSSNRLTRQTPSTDKRARQTNSTDMHPRHICAQ